MKSRNNHQEQALFMKNQENKTISEPKEKIENGFTCKEVRIIGDKQKFLTNYENGGIMRFIYDKGILYLSNEHLDIYKKIDSIKPSSALEGYFGLANQKFWPHIDYLNFYRCTNDGITTVLHELRSGKYLKSLTENLGVPKNQITDSINQHICDFLGQPDYVNNKL